MKYCAILLAGVILLLMGTEFVLRFMSLGQFRQQSQSVMRPEAEWQVDGQKVVASEQLFADFLNVGFPKYRHVALLKAFDVQITSETGTISCSMQQSSRFRSEFLVSWRQTNHPMVVGTIVSPTLAAIRERKASEEKKGQQHKTIQ